MNTLKRIWENIKWLCNHPPTNIVEVLVADPCTYCGKNDYGTTSYTYAGKPHFVLCYNCLKRVCDKVLLEEK